MPAYAQRQRTVRPRERGVALAAVAVVQLAIGLALLIGLKVPVSRTADVVQRLIDVALPQRAPPPPPPPVKPAAKPEHANSPAPKAEPKPLAGSPGPQPAHAPPTVAPVVPIRPNAAPSGGGSGTDPALGSGAGGGTGGAGYGEDGGGDLEQIAGDFLPSDYPPELGRAGIGGRVSVTFTVLPNGRVTACRVSRSSRIPELDALTCRIIEQRFRFRPSTDRYGRPVADEADLDQDWIPPRMR